jgi:DNA helicase HerA-like ATPase
MAELEVVGSIIRGRHGHLMIRQKSDAKIELGDLLIVEEENGYSILQVFDLGYGSQISPKSLEMISGMQVEGYGADLGFMDPNLRNYVIAEVKALVTIIPGRVRIPKNLPQFLKQVRHITKDDLTFITQPPTPLYVGNIRSGSKVLEVPVYLDAESALTHHILCPATTGRGKSNLIKTMIWSIVPTSKIGLLVLDPHDEYFGRHGKGLKDHPEASEKVDYYSPQKYPGAITPVFNLKTLRTSHLRGIVSFSDAQIQALAVAQREYKEDWIKQIMLGAELPDVGKTTKPVLRRVLSTTLDIYVDDNAEIQSNTGTFSSTLGETTLGAILRKLEYGHKVIIDTSLFSDQVELLIGSIILDEILNRYKFHKKNGVLDQKPIINAIIEEAPRVLSVDAIAGNSNIYGDIAREGRKFKVGLTAITQLTSLIPRTVLANMNTKIILGNELKYEREAIINSAAQDLSTDDQNIASLDIGEAIVSSNFTKFAIPIQIPLFEDYIKQSEPKKRLKTGLVGGP